VSSSLYLKSRFIFALLLTTSLAPAAWPANSGFTPQSRVGFTTGDQWEPAIAADGYGHVYVLYPQYVMVPRCPNCPVPTMILVVSNDNGNTWETPRQIAPNLWAHEPDVFFNISRYWRTIQSYFSSLFAWVGLYAVLAAEMAIASPLLEASMDGAHGVLLSVSGGSDLGLFEINEAAQLVADAAHPEANIIFGAVIDERMGGEVKISVIATAFEAARAIRRLEGPMYKRQAPSMEQRVTPTSAVAPAPITAPHPRIEESK